MIKRLIAVGATVALLLWFLLSGQGARFFAAVSRGVKPRRQPRRQAAVSATLVI